MCGLIAYYKTSDQPLYPRLIEDMTHSLEHRGPDDYGLCFVGAEGPTVWRNGDKLAPFTRAHGSLIPCLLQERAVHLTKFGRRRRDRQFIVSDAVWAGFIKFVLKNPRNAT